MSQEQHRHESEFLVSQEQRHKKIVSCEPGAEAQREFFESQGRGKKRVACERGAEAQKRVPFVPENDARVSDV